MSSAYHPAYAHALIHLLSLSLICLMGGHAISTWLDTAYWGIVLPATSLCLLHVTSSENNWQRFLALLLGYIGLGFLVAPWVNILQLERLLLLSVCFSGAIYQSSSQSELLGYSYVFFIPITTWLLPIYTVGTWGFYLLVLLFLCQQVDQSCNDRQDELDRILWLAPQFARFLFDQIYAILSTPCRKSHHHNGSTIASRRRSTAQKKTSA